MLACAFGHWMTPCPILLTSCREELPDENHVFKTAEIDRCSETGACSIRVTVVQHVWTTAFDSEKEKKKLF